jgi:hypothetical protein
VNINSINNGPEILLKYRCISCGEEVCGASGSLKPLGLGFIPTNINDDGWVTVNLLEIVTSILVVDALLRDVP